MSLSENKSIGRCIVMPAPIYNRKTSVHRVIIGIVICGFCEISVRNILVPQMTRIKEDYFVFFQVGNKLVQCIDNLHIHAELVVSYTFLIS